MGRPRGAWSSKLDETAPDLAKAVIAGHLSLREAAEQLGVSTARLTTWIRTRTGMTLTEHRMVARGWLPPHGVGE